MNHSEESLARKTRLINAIAINLSLSADLKGLLIDAINHLIPTEQGFETQGETIIHKAVEISRRLAASTTPSTDTPPTWVSDIIETISTTLTAEIRHSNEQLTAYIHERTDHQPDDNELEANTETDFASTSSPTEPDPFSRQPNADEPIGLIRIGLRALDYSDDTIDWLITTAGTLAESSPFTRLDILTAYFRCAKSDWHGGSVLGTPGCEHALHIQSILTTAAHKLATNNPKCVVPTPYGPAKPAAIDPASPHPEFRTEKDHAAQAGIRKPHTIHTLQVSDREIEFSAMKFHRIAPDQWKALPESERQDAIEYYRNHGRKQLEARILPIQINEPIESFTESEGGYLSRQPASRALSPVSDFTIKVVGTQPSPAGLIRLVTFHKPKNQKASELKASDLRSSRAFRSWCLSHGSYHWAGNNADLARLIHHIDNQYHHAL